MERMKGRIEGRKRTGIKWKGNRKGRRREGKG